MSPSTSKTKTDTSAARLDQLVALVSERVEAGESVDLDELTADCPDLRQPLETLLPALKAVVELEKAQSNKKCSQEVLAGTGHDLLREALGDFRILRELGRGGMGVVYEAEQISLGRRVALKVLPLAATLNTQQLQRFKNEARAAATLKHPHIVGVLTVGAERGVHYYAMELIEGRSLAETIQEMRIAEVGTRNEEVNNLASDHSTLDDPNTAHDTSPVAALSTARSNNELEFYRQAARIIADAAEAIGFAHSHGIVHRDVKPANLLIDNDAHVWVADFGLARLDRDVGVTMTGDMMGTPRYMSPEQACGRREFVDHRADVYSLGVTLYELLALRPPYLAEDRAELIRQIDAGSHPSLTKLLPSLAVDLETIAGKAMEREPVDRYQTADEMASDLRRFIENRTILARPPTPAEQVAKWASRHRRFVWVGLATLVLATVSLSIGSALIFRAQQAASAALDDVEAERNRAERNLKLAIKALDQVYTEILGLQLQDHPALTRLREQSLTQVVDFYEQFAQQNRLNETSWPEVGRAYLLVGEVNSQLERWNEAYDGYSMAHHVYGQINAIHPGREDIRDLNAASYRAMAKNSLETTDCYDAPVFCSRAIHLLELGQSSEATVPFPLLGVSADRRACIAETYGELAEALRRLDSPDDAAEALSAALERMQPLVEEQPNNAEFHRCMADLRRQESALQAELDRFEAAAAAMSSAISHRETALSLGSSNVALRRGLRDDYEQLCSVYFRNGKPIEDEHNQQVVAVFESWRKQADAIARDYPQVVDDQRCAIMANLLLGVLYQKRGRSDEAVALQQQLLERRRVHGLERDMWDALSLGSMFGGVANSVLAAAEAVMAPSSQQISLEDAMRMIDLNCSVDAARVALSHDRVNEARRQYRRAARLRDQLKATLVDPDAEQYFDDMVGAMEEMASEHSDVFSELRASTTPRER